MKPSDQDFSEEQQEVLESIRLSRAIIPVLLGVLAVVYLMYSQLNPSDPEAKTFSFSDIPLTNHALFWIAMAVLLLVIRHLAYAYRLWIMSSKFFSYAKCLKLIFIWEFSSAVSPTSVGGSAVALFVLAQEKLSTARTATIVVYSIVLDTTFFITTLPILFALFGTNIIRPGFTDFSNLDIWGYTFFGAYILMAAYGGFFFYGLFKNPNKFKDLLMWFTKFEWTERFRKSAIALGDDIIIASGSIMRQSFVFHIKSFLSTAVAWSCRFLLLNCLIIALVPSTSTDIITQGNLYSRLETMFVIMAFSPTPGGAGIAEIVFNGFLKDYVPAGGISVIIAFIWRLLTYYAYLLAGAIIIPSWLAKILKQRKLRKLKKLEEQEGLDKDLA